MKVHILGVGGIGLGGIAEYLLGCGFIISGSDVVKNAQVNRLESLGVKVYINDTPLSVIDDADVIIYSSAIKKGDVSFDYAIKQNKCMYSRSQVLGLLFKSYDFSIGIAGSHGKTTTTSMIANVINYSKIPLLAFIGGEDKKLGNYVSTGKGVLLAEVCEYNKNIKDITAKLSVVLNVDDDHMDCYKTIKNLKNEFFSYLDRSKIKIINADDVYLKEYNGKNVIGYGINTKCCYQGYNLSCKEGKYSFFVKDKNSKEHKVNLSVSGYHNVYNALASFAVCDYYLSISPDDIVKSLNLFSGVKRRFEEIGKINNSIIIADYCHHPEEIKSTLENINRVYNSDCLIVFQPHTYSRTKILFDKFVKLFNNKNVIIFKEYSAREEYDYLGSAKYLSEKLNKSVYIEEISLLKEVIKNSNKGYVFILGAGDLYDKFKIE